MKVIQQGGLSIVTGKEKERESMRQWIELADHEIAIDESDEWEVCFVCCARSRYLTQAERQEDFQFAKKKLKNKSI